MHKRIAAIGWGLLLVFSLGCNSDSAPPPAEAEIGQQAKAQINQFVEQARTQPKTAPERLSILMESLQSYASQYEGPYVELHATAQELHAMYQRSAGADEIKQQLDKLSQQAAALPG